MNVIEIAGLRKEYRSLRGQRTLALQGLDLEVEGGGVFGFLGPNGSGKTTTIRCLLGLSRASAGTCRILGKDSQTALHEVLGSVGSVVETPALFPTFSGRRNLELLAATGRVSRRRIGDVLELVGLSERENTLVKNYSLGMRQRLALAAALLKDPELLILDEPANGLDPGGIREIRHLLRRLGEGGRTVFVSSHILTEVEQTCDRVAILSRGKCVTSGPVAEVLSGGRMSAMVVKVDDTQRGLAILTAAGLRVVIRDGVLHVEDGGRDGALIARLLAEHDVYPQELRPKPLDLETVFLQLTEDYEEAAA